MVHTACSVAAVKFIYIIADEPYRELAYDGVEVPYIPHFYENTIVAYSFSKSLSLPGDRIGYLVIPSTVADFAEVSMGAAIANRVLGFVNAPALQQMVVAKCCEETTDVAFYNANRELLYNALQEYGYTCTKPQGAFYMFVKALEEDDKAFCEKAKEYRLLVTPGSAFGCKGYVRISYCVARETIENSLPSFKALAESYNEDCFSSRGSEMRSRSTLPSAIHKTQPRRFSGMGAQYLPMPYLCNIG